MASDSSACPQTGVVQQSVTYKVEKGFVCHNVTNGWSGVIELLKAAEGDARYGTGTLVCYTSIRNHHDGREGAQEPRLSGSASYQGDQNGPAA